MFWHNVEAELFEQSHIETITPETVKGHRIEKHRKCWKRWSKVEQENVGVRSGQGGTGRTGRTWWNRKKTSETLKRGGSINMVYDIEILMGCLALGLFYLNFAMCLLNCSDQSIKSKKS